MISEIITMFSNEPLLLFPAFSPCIVGSFFFFIFYKKQMKQYAAKIAASCLNKNPKWGDDDINIDEALEFGSHSKTLTYLQKNAEKLEEKINEIEKKTHILMQLSPKTESYSSKNVIIKIGKFKNKKKKIDEHLTAQIPFNSFNSRFD